MARESLLLRHISLFDIYRRIARNPRRCARFAIVRAPGEHPRRHESAESTKPYPGATRLGPWIIAVNSPADRTRAKPARLRPTAIREAADDR